MPAKPSKGVLHLLKLAERIERMEQDHALLVMRIEDAYDEFEKAARAYGLDGNDLPELSRSSRKDGPWTDSELSAPDRVRAYFRVHPSDKTTAQDLIDAGIDVKIENLRSTLHRMAKKGELFREGAGVYTLAKPEQGEPDS